MRSLLALLVTTVLLTPRCNGRLLSVATDGGGADAEGSASGAQASDAGTSSNGSAPPNPV